MPHGLTGAQAADLGEGDEEAEAVAETEAGVDNAAAEAEAIAEESAE